MVRVASEFIENNGEEAQSQETMGEEKRKQDCETKAFKRLSGKIKKHFRDCTLYCWQTACIVMNICRDNSWEFLIRYKKGSISSIAEEYEKIPEKEMSGHAEFVNDIDYNRQG